VTTGHGAKLAYVYVRQSSLNQVKHHQESTELQYRLVGWSIALLRWAGLMGERKSSMRISANQAPAAPSVTASRN
jgi:hypothetical protein